MKIQKHLFRKKKCDCMKFFKEFRECQIESVTENLSKSYFKNSGFSQIPEQYRNGTLKNTKIENFK